MSRDAYPVEESLEQLGLEVVHIEQTRGLRPGAARYDVRMRSRAVQLASRHRGMRSVAWAKSGSASRDDSLVLFDALVNVALNDGQEVCSVCCNTSSVRQRKTVLVLHGWQNVKDYVHEATAVLKQCASRSTRRRGWRGSSGYAPASLQGLIHVILPHEHVLAFEIKASNNSKIA